MTKRYFCLYSSHFSVKFTWFAMFSHQRFDDEPLFKFRTLCFIYLHFEWPQNLFLYEYYEPIANDIGFLFMENSKNLGFFLKKHPHLLNDPNMRLWMFVCLREKYIDIILKSSLTPFLITYIYLFIYQSPSDSFSVCLSHIFCLSLSIYLSICLSVSLSLSLSLSLYLSRCLSFSRLYTYIYIYIYTCVCVRFQYFINLEWFRFLSISCNCFFQEKYISRLIKSEN